MSAETNNARAVDGMISPGEDIAGRDPYLISAVNQTTKQDKKHFSEALSAVLDEMGDTTLGRRATLIRMARKN